MERVHGMKAEFQQQKYLCGLSDLGIIFLRFEMLKEFIAKKSANPPNSLQIKTNHRNIKRGCHTQSNS